MAGNADWVVDADTHNLNTSSGAVTTGGSESNPQRTPSPVATAITGSTTETYWDGALSAWGVGLAKTGYTDIQTLPYNGKITYHDYTNAQDLSYYKAYIVDEPNILFTASEKTAIINYVAGGGSLFMIADHGGSDRNNDGSDATQVWNDLYTNNSVVSNPFGVSFNGDTIGSSGFSSTFVDTSTSDPLITGPAGVATQLKYDAGSTLTITTANNSTVKAAVWQTSAHSNASVMAAYATYGKGHIVAIGDSSPIDDGTGDSGDTLFNGWDDKGSGTTPDSTLILNASRWLVTSAVTPAPEPSGATIILSGLLCLALFGTRRRFAELKTQAAKDRFSNFEVANFEKE